VEGFLNTIQTGNGANRMEKIEDPITSGRRALRVTWDLIGSNYTIILEIPENRIRILGGLSCNSSTNSGFLSLLTGR